MPEIFEQIKYLKEAKAPAPIRKGIYRRVLIIKFKPLIYFAAIIFLGSFVLLSRYIYQSLVETESIRIVQVIAQDFELNLDYIGNSLVSLNEVLLTRETLLWLLNSLVVFSLLELFRRYRHELLKLDN